MLRHLGLLDAQLEQLLAKPLTDEAVRQLMRVALYQLQFTRAAPHAVVDQAVSAGVKGILNFSPGVFNVPDDVKIKNVDLTVSLESLSFYLAQGDPRG